MLQQPAEARLTADLVQTRDRRRRLFIVVGGNQPVADPLVRSALMVVGDVFADDVIEVKTCI